MYIYFNNQGTLTTILHHGEPIIRQGSTLSFSVLFDSLCPYISSPTNGATVDSVVTMQIRKPGEKSFGNERVLTRQSNLYHFTAADANEQTYDLVEGNDYIEYKYTGSDLDTSKYGNLEVVIKVYLPVQADVDGDTDIDSNDVSVTQTTILTTGLIVLYIEKTYGNAEKTVPDLQNEYNYLLAVIGTLYNRITGGTGVVDTGTLKVKFIQSNLIPYSNNTYHIGSSESTWVDLHLTNGKITIAANDHLKVNNYDYKAAIELLNTAVFGRADGSSIVSSGIIAALFGTGPAGQQALANYSGNTFLQRIIDLESDNSSNKSRLNTLESDNSSNKSRLNTLESDNTSNKSRLNTLESDNSSNKSRLNNLEAEVGTQNNPANGTLRKRVADLESDNSSNKSRLNTLESDNSSNKNRLDTLESDNSSNKNRLDLLEGSDFQSQIDAINAGQNLADIVADITALQTYSATNLRVNDKIQVLVDRNHNNASTAYNWIGTGTPGAGDEVVNNTTGKFVYIGPYGQDSYQKSEVYTKQETEAVVDVERARILALETEVGAQNNPNQNSLRGRMDSAETKITALEAFRDGLTAITNDEIDALFS